MAVIFLALTLPPRSLSERPDKHRDRPRSKRDRFHVSRNRGTGEDGREATPRAKVLRHEFLTCILGALLTLSDQETAVWFLLALKRHFYLSFILGLTGLGDLEVWVNLSHFVPFFRHLSPSLLSTRWQSRHQRVPPSTRPLPLPPALGGLGVQQGNVPRPSNRLIRWDGHMTLSCNAIGVIGMCLV